MSYEFYKVLHIAGAFGILFSLGGLALHVMNGGSRNHPFRRWTGIAHGISLLIALVGGFGLLARLGFIKGMPAWAMVKIAIWLVLGGIPTLFYRKSNLAKPLWFVTWALAVLATWFAVNKPF